MKVFRFFLTFLIVSFLCLSLIVSGNTGPPKKGGTLVIGTAKDPQGVDIHRVMGIQGIAISHQIYDGLLNFDDEGNLVPGLAVSMPEQPDPATYIFTLRKGVKFHNGADFDARDVKSSLDRMMNKEISRYWKGYRAIIKSVEIVDPYKVTITLKAPYVPFLEMVAKLPENGIVPRGSGTTIKHPIGTGPFKFKEWIKDDRLTLVKNEHYWAKGLPYLDEIIYKPFPEASTRVINIMTGKVDVVHNLPIQDAVEMKKNPRIKVLGRAGAQSEQLYMNTAKPPFNNKKVRQAVAYGIDRQAIADSVFMGLAEVANDLFPSWYWANNPDIKAYPYNPEKAKGLLKEAGYSAQNPLSFTIMCTNDPIFVDQAVIIQSHLAKIGVKVNVMPVEKSYRVDAQFGRKGRDYEALISGASDDMTQRQWVYRMYSGKSYINLSGYNRKRYGKKGAQNPEAERLIDEVLTISDRSRARKMYDKIQKMILDDVPMLKLSFFQGPIGMWDYVKNHKVLTRNNIPLKEVWVEK
jgi:peptide/nickel transport system substrate-binding protein